VVVPTQRASGRWCLVVALWIALGSGVRPGWASGGDERCVYRVSWNGIPAASASATLSNGEATTQLHVEMRTNAFVDLFWSLRAQTTAQVEAATLHPQGFAFERRIDGHPELTRIDVEGDGELVGRYARPGRYRLIAVRDSGVTDPVAAILQARRGLPAIGGSATYEVFTGEARYRVVLHVVASESIRVPAGRFAALRIEPEIWRVEGNDQDRRVRRLTLWVAAVPPHTLLRVRSEVFIGAVYVDLVEWSRGDGRVGAPQ
jgi:hypothetical protein